MVNRVLAACIFLSLFVFLPEQRGWTSEATIKVNGIGYPPVKAQNKTQALLMARRAAVLDAYRRALSMQGDYAGPEEEGEGFYRGLSGFVKGVTIVSEEYLQDGGVKIEAFLFKKTLSPSDKRKSTGKEVPTSGPRRIGGPTSVSVEEWYRIIGTMVRFETNDLR